MPILMHKSGRRTASDMKGKQILMEPRLALTYRSRITKTFAHTGKVGERGIPIHIRSTYFVLLTSWKRDSRCTSLAQCCYAGGSGGRPHFLFISIFNGKRIARPYSIRIRLSYGNDPPNHGKISKYTNYRPKMGDDMQTKPVEEINFLVWFVDMAWRHFETGLTYFEKTLLANNWHDLSPPSLPPPLSLPFCSLTAPKPE